MCYKPEQWPRASILHYLPSNFRRNSDEHRIYVNWGFPIDSFSNFDFLIVQGIKLLEIVIVLYHTVSELYSGSLNGIHEAINTLNETNNASLIGYHSRSRRSNPTRGM